LAIARSKAISTAEIAMKTRQKAISGQLRLVLAKLIQDKLLEWTIPDKPRSTKQQYRIKERGITFLQLVQKNK